VLDLFDELAFDNPDGGVWKQGYDIKYDVESFKEEPLQVFVAPHSHNDPGQHHVQHYITGVTIHWTGILD